LRNLDNPFKNLEYTGIDTARVMSMEERLREDVLAEAAAHGGRLLLHDEGDDGKVLLHFVEITPVRPPPSRFVHMKFRVLCFSVRP
jgi:hypothetical protein